ncbi:MAG: hypothetical protein KDA24_06395 [Deltaproteobacteria bacterium]|nr:hypothetical protein [Deltaproteobacteria bacterium]
MSARLLSFPLLLVFLLGLIGCPTTGGRSGDDDDLTSVDDDDSSGDDDDDATTPPPPETECSDGIDNDMDGDTDCDDSDCAAVEYCTWPFSLSHSGSFDYDASIAAQIGGYDDCRTDFTASLEFETDTAEQCPTCNRTFTGAMSYPFDDCPAGDEPRPTSVTYGFVFFNALQWQVYVEDADGIWTLVGDAFDDGTGTFVHNRTDEVIVEEVDGGDLETTLSFTPPTD